MHIYAGEYVYYITCHKRRIALLIEILLHTWYLDLLFIALFLFGRFDFRFRFEFRVRCCFTLKQTNMLYAQSKKVKEQNEDNVLCKHLNTVYILF